MSKRLVGLYLLLLLGLVATGCSRGGGDDPKAAGGTASPTTPDGSTASTTGTPGATTTPKVASKTPRPPTAKPTKPQPKPTATRKPRPKPTPTPPRKPRVKPRITNWVYQLQGYQNDRLDALAAAPHQLAVIDLARDANTDYWTSSEISKLRNSGKKVLAYFEIGSIENFRHEYAQMQREAPSLILNRWEDWPQEYFVKYWDKWWWDNVMRPRLDQARKAGFDGVYLDTPLAYEEIELSEVPGESRSTLGRKMADLIIRMSSYSKSHNADFWIFPQNSPELRHHKGYTEAIDGIGMEELFFLATDEACTESYCRENLDNTRALRDAGKIVLAVDYVSAKTNRDKACEKYASERFAGYATDLELDRIRPPCP